MDVEADIGIQKEILGDEMGMLLQKDTTDLGAELSGNDSVGSDDASDENETVQLQPLSPLSSLLTKLKIQEKVLVVGGIVDILCHIRKLRNLLFASRMQEIKRRLRDLLLMGLLEYLQSHQNCPSDLIHFESE